MTPKTQKISRSFQRWLLLLVIIAFVLTTVFLWVSQTRLSENNAIDLLRLNISDVRQDIIDASDENLLALTREVTAEVEELDVIDSAALIKLAEERDIAEIDVIDENGIIAACTNESFVGFDMASGEQSAEFLVLLHGETEYVQSYQPISFDASLSRKYGGVALQDGGFVQVGYDAEHFQKDIDALVIGLTRNRHVGEGGSIIIADEDWNIVSDRQGNEGKNLEVTGIWIDTEAMAEGDYFECDVYGEPCYCMYAVSEGYYIVAVMPQSEAVLSRNLSVGITTAMEIIIFAALFVLVYILIKRLVVDNISRINGSLAEITDGNLDTVVDVRSHEEFAMLSDDINETVGTLKRCIADAAARIDAELEFARSIQHSALPSVFPPYPHRPEFEIWAQMDTAKEVGGDFYDFYFVNKDTFAFLVADVSGKGIPAAMFMMTAKTIIKSCAESRMDIDELFTRVNEKLCEGNDAGMFVTAWMGIMNIKTGVITFANAGHNPPAVKMGDNPFDYHRTRPNLVLAGMEGLKYRKYELQLQPGDILYLYTDGVTEATDIENNLYGDDRLLAVLDANRDADAETLCAAVKADVDAFAGSAPQFDDITMLCLKFFGP